MFSRIDTYYHMIQHKHYDALKFNLDHDAAEILELMDINGENVFHKAVHCGDAKMVALLLKYNVKAAAYKNLAGVNPIVLAANLYHWDCVLAFAASCKEQKDTVSYASSVMFDVTPEQIRAFNHHDHGMHAIPGNYPGVIVKRYEFSNVLLIAAAANQLQVVQALIKATGFCPGMLKPIGNWYTSAKEITKSYDQTTRNTALHYAVLNSNIPMIQLLVQHGADLYAMNRENYSPLLLAAVKGLWDVVIAITKAAKNDKHLYGYALTLAAYYNQTEVVKVLLKGETFPKEWYEKNKKDNALHYAVKNNNPEMVAILMLHKANPNELNQDQKTPSALAVDLNYSDCLEALINPHKFLNKDSDLKAAKPSSLKTPVVHFKPAPPNISERTPLLEEHKSQSVVTHPNVRESK